VLLMVGANSNHGIALPWQEFAPATIRTFFYLSTQITDNSHGFQ
jgi:hypothetical protein